MPTVAISIHGEPRKTVLGETFGRQEASAQGPGSALGGSVKIGPLFRPEDSNPPVVAPAAPGVAAGVCQSQALKIFPY